MLRQAVRDSGLTRNRIAKLAGIEYSAMWRFMANERCDPVLSTADKLVKALGLQVILTPAQQTKRKA